MTTTASVGFSENPRSRDAGIEAGRAAMAGEGVNECSLAILYSTSKHDPAELRDGLRSVIGPEARLIGGYAIGAFTQGELGYEGHQVGVAVFSSDSMQVDMFIESGLTDNEHNVGVALGEQINSGEYAGTPNVLLMYDSVKEKPTGRGFSLNLATPLIEGLGKALRQWPPAAGVGMLGDWHGNPGYQWFDDRIEQQAASALVLSGDVRMDTIIMHGCRPSSGYHTITKVDGNVVLEIDGVKAVDFVSQLLDPDSFKTWEDFPFFVTLGINKGEKWGEFEEENYANRMTMAVDPELGGLIMFENDLRAGDEFQLMRRSIDFDYIGQRAEDLLERLGDRRAFFALYIDCAGRAAAYCGTDREEAEEVQRVIGSRMPLLGMYSGVEIAKVGEDMQALDWTGVLCVFSE